MPAKPDRELPVLLREYRPPAWRVDHVDLEFDLGIHRTRVDARLTLRRAGPAGEPLFLDGEGLRLVSIALDGRPLDVTEYRLDEHGLTIAQMPDGAVLHTCVELDPSTNSALQGLYLSGTPEHGFLLTQCEAEGFRRITFFPDRPDVLARYTTTLRADPARFPILLANGNPAGTGLLDDGRLWARWDDPHPKPCYLFALVAGRLEVLERAFVTAEGRAVTLRIYAEADAIDRCGYAMDALERAMRWDEEHYGRCYDLDVFHIVATHDFNMGAMENKGLNIFNAKYLLADPARSTDDDYRHVEAIVAHEYFHNWTGNRVTCRDWFQLSLKEGLTVFREQQFSADMGSHVLKRIEDVQLLRRAQFPEDAGPLAHPVRPDRYSAIDNFYTATVYDKGAELVRMLAGRLGPAGWRRGMDEYFARHDGEAATVEDFLAALGEANEVDLRGYLVWYAQAGTPQLLASGRYDAAHRTYTLELRQHTAPTPGQDVKQPLPVPVRLALLDAGGQPLPLRGASAQAAVSECVVELRDAQAAFTFVDIDRPRAASLLRGFSAPVRVEAGFGADDLAFLVRHESDGFNRWEAAQQLARLAFDRVLAGDLRAAEIGVWVSTVSALLDDNRVEPALLAELLTPPDALELAERCEPFDPAAVYRAREFLEKSLAQVTGARVAARHGQLVEAEQGALDGASQSRRRLAGRCLGLWMRADPTAAAEVAARRAAQAPNMTERLAALTLLAHHGAPQAEAALGDFAARYADDPITLDKWFALQAQIPAEAAVERVAALRADSRFNLRNPNRVYALLRAFAARNLVAFHRPDGAGYALIEDCLVELDAINPTTASRLAATLKDWKRLEPTRRVLLQASVERLAAAATSPDLADILRRTLA
ncbi:aminopeptidase N [Tahibacter amnicola]|uniref:Aminopeptidase N n=1 Tax=Tahibacter amnicola TaxID=2976241 RepID=A0ABY6BDT0_9GAMM|nr:aminopeptidase N [Tahibacter amnicola]UXI68179.1 aminopeptidase N [Tahibacter amnicola]